ncbi:cysteine dioxygenase [Acidovorax sp. NCPPB 4044]|uniref:cysteine dioxygenase n=1 Tax=Acidovorax sp. NCPPB 4044 TaxID=2940490 RepID=UPI002303880D|nr:cysteine dioxygenase family protein [Acidovorax sp. NCPPB 4044]MDA8519564.1 cysteine dioxygenase family protein [Acidovorax sp. NCPPB 4044]
MPSAQPATHVSPIKLHLVSRDAAQGDFRITGQGTASVRLPADAGAHSLTIALRPAKPGKAPAGACGLTVDAASAVLWVEKNGERYELARSTAPKALLQAHTNQSYWLSLDSNNRRLRYGKGEMLLHLMQCEYAFPETSDPLGLGKLAPTLGRVEVRGAGDHPHLLLRPIPVNLDPAPLVVRPEDITLDLIAQNTVSVAQNLPKECQLLYANVAGPNIRLASPDFPEFAQAIQYSIATPGKMCFEKLKEKAGGEGGFSYLRITLDGNLGDSPGQPYVLEVWPAGSHSPIHDHGQANAIIKVLHGQILIEWFGTLSPQDETSWGHMLAHAGDVTFLTPQYYQIHRLSNPSPRAGGDFCATIQCYRYANKDRQHYEFFDYIDDKEQRVEHFRPDSDWTYREFKQLIQKEWAEAMHGLSPTA